MSREINFELPSPETLAGIYICVEGEEDLTVRPRQIQPVLIADHPPNGPLAAPDSPPSGKSDKVRPD